MLFKNITTKITKIIPPDVLLATRLVTILNYNVLQYLQVMHRAKVKVKHLHHA